MVGCREPAAPSFHLAREPFVCKCAERVAFVNDNAHVVGCRRAIDKAIDTATAAAASAVVPHGGCGGVLKRGGGRTVAGKFHDERLEHTGNKR